MQINCSKFRGKTKIKIKTCWYVFQFCWENSKCICIHSNAPLWLTGGSVAKGSTSTQWSSVASLANKQWRAFQFCSKTKWWWIDCQTALYPPKILCKKCTSGQCKHIWFSVGIWLLEMITEVSGDQWYKNIAKFTERNKFLIEFVLYRYAFCIYLLKILRSMNWKGITHTGPHSYTRKMSEKKI